MLLISWNVAGWSATSAAIRDSFGSLHAFFEYTGADLICIQECKGSMAKLTNNPVDMGASDPPPAKRKRVPPLVEATASPRPTPTTGNSHNGGVEGWESFWSFSGPQHRGFNGVVTFARKGLTWRCDARPFADDALNDEGRVVVTHHSAFVLVNVYVPNARRGVRSEFKSRFLSALRDVMNQLRADTGKPIVLVGDLNMTYRAEDAVWSLRRFHLGELLRLYTTAQGGSDTEWAMRYPNLPKPVLLRVSNLIANHLCAHVAQVAPAAVPTPSQAMAPSSSSSTSGTLLAESVGSLGSSSQKTPVTVAADALPIEDDLCDQEKLRAVHAAVMDFLGPKGDGHQLLCTTAEPPVPLQELYAVGFRSVFVDDLTRSYPATHNRELYTVVQHCGLPPHGTDACRFMGALLDVPVRHARDLDAEVETSGGGSEPLLENGLVGDGGEHAASPHPPSRSSTSRMWDTFVLSEGATVAKESGVPTMTPTRMASGKLPPGGDSYCPCPYTCWDQSRNRRLTNEGTRLDYILVDTALVPAVCVRETTENNVGFFVRPSFPPGQSVERGEDDFFAELSGSCRADGIRRAMADGCYPPAPYDGSGMPPLADGARGYMFRGLPSTGLFVTPPQFSDHIGVCVRFRSPCGANQGREDCAVSGFTLQARPGKVVEDHPSCMYRPPVGLQSFFRRAVDTGAASVREKPKPSSVPSKLGCGAKSVGDRAPCHGVAVASATATAASHASASGNASTPETKRFRGDMTSSTAPHPKPPRSVRETCVIDVDDENEGPDS